MKKTLMICSNENAYYFDHVHIPGLSIRGLFKNHAEFNNPVSNFSEKRNRDGHVSFIRIGSKILIHMKK